MLNVLIASSVLSVTVLLLLAAGAVLLLRRGEYAFVPDGSDIAPYEASKQRWVDRQRAGLSVQ